MKLLDASQTISQEIADLRLFLALDLYGILCHEKRKSDMRRLLWSLQRIKKN